MNSANGLLNDQLPKSNGQAASRKAAQSDVNLRWAIAQLRYYKWPLLLFLVSFTLVAFLIAKSIQPVYQTSGTLLINEAKNRYSYAGSDLSNLLTTSYGLGVGSSFSNQLEILRSRKIATEVADRILVNPVLPNGNRYPILWQEYPDDSTQINKDQLINRIRGNLRVGRKESSADLVEVTFESYSSVEAASMVNLIIDTYTEVSTQQNTQSARSAKEFLNEQRGQMSGELQQAEEELKNFQERTGLVAVESQTTGDFAKLNQLEQKRQEQRIRLMSINTAIENYRSQFEELRPGFSRNFSENVAPMLSSLQNRLGELEAERILLLSKNPDLEENPQREPQLVELNSQITSLKNTIEQRANNLLVSSSDSLNGDFLSGGNGANRISGLQEDLVQARIEKAQTEAQLDVIDELIQQEEVRMDQVPEEILQLERLRRDLSMKESLYKTISQQYAETSLWEQTQSGAGIPLDYATVPNGPVEPNILLFLFGGLFLGSVFGVGYIYYRVETNTEIDSPGRMAEIPYPLLSVIPDFTQEEGFKRNEIDNVHNINENWITLYDSNSSSAEAFRKLQNNILYSQPDISIKTLMVTSSEQGEGKTSVSLNLATTLTEAGKKVLIIDTDLRRPNLHRLATLNKAPGLMDTIFENKPLSDCIQISRSDNVHILTVGTRPPNPSAILRSDKVAEMVQRLRNDYDYVVFDTAPLGIIGDAAPLIRYVDGVICVAKFRQTDTGQLKNLISELEHLHAPILGTVLTSYDREKSTYSYYHNSKYYHSYESYREYVESE